ncbi:(2Fe-2S)-binding protein [Faecalibacter rhinopitheci]|uniref:(2Fe-2S)-binding protein n=1 Tax=Faecalibacter rhinopitheci TaxID=2779678 RepID=A0A8J7FQ24_9FLAO|nr:(2Fe-2S)-binding protein [Faecalibacter rhinopitheci]MBF0596023.1 (2Fe-2S)-binding protein [Faecalibacter rhinopitheci]
MRNKSKVSRRFFLKTSSLITVFSLLPSTVKALYEEAKQFIIPKKKINSIILNINNKNYSIPTDTRSTLLDVLREQLHFTGTKKGCDHGQCGACTVHIDGKTALSCLTLASMVKDKKITTIEGIATGEELHPMQEAFISYDGFQCGYCTPGQIMSAIACVNEGKTKSENQIKEFMSGNLCRCGAYNGIVESIQKVAKV